MQRLVLLILIGFIANWYWRNLQRQREAAGRARREGTQAGGRGAANVNAGNAARAPSGKAAGRDTQAARLALPEPMVRCAQCDMHLPVSEATASLGRHFCGPKHAHDYAVRVAQAGDGR